MDAGVPLATIQRWLGHHNISQTSTYLAASGEGDADAMRAFEDKIGRKASESAGHPNDSSVNDGALAQGDRSTVH